MHPVLRRVLESSDLSTAGDLFLISDPDVLRDLPEIIRHLDSIIRCGSYITSANDQSVVEICMTRITSAVRESRSLPVSAPLLLSLLQKCGEYDHGSATTRADTPHAKIASDIMNCVFLNYANRDVMELAIPVGIRFLTGPNPELSRNISCYFSLIAIQHPFLIAPYAGDLVKGALRGNPHLIRILPQLYTGNPKPVLKDVESLVRLLHRCEKPEQLSLLALSALVAKDYPQDLWPVVSDMSSLLGDPDLAGNVLRVFLQIALNNPVPFLTHMNRIKKAVDSIPGLFGMSAAILGALSKLGETVAQDCVQFLISRSVTLENGDVAMGAREIHRILVLYPALSSHVSAQLSNYLMNGNTNAVILANALYASGSSEDLNDSNSRIEPPPYGSSDLSAFSQRPLLPHHSPHNSRLYGLHRTSVDVRQIATASNKSLSNAYGSTGNVPLKQANEHNPRSLFGSGSHGSVSGNLIVKSSHQSLASKGHSRHSLGSSGILSVVNHKSSRSFTLGTGKNDNTGPVEHYTKIAHVPSLSPIYSRPEDQPSQFSDRGIPMETDLSTFTVENPSLSKSSEAINIRSRRNSRHSLAPRPRSRLLETSNQPQVIQVVPIHDAVYQFCERNLDKIRKYMASIFVRFPLPAKCVIEQHKSRKHCKLSFVCQCKGDQCLYASRYFSFRTKIPKVWMHLMFLAIQAKASTTLNQQDSAVHALRLCWDRLDNGKDFSTLVTSAFPSSRDQEDLLRELSGSRYFDVFEYNATIKQWGCFLCNYPEKANAMFFNGAPVMEGVLKEKKGRWTFLRRWRSRYFTLSGPYLSYKSSSEKLDRIDMRRIRSVKAVNPRGIRAIPTVFEIFTNDNKLYLLKAKDPNNAEQWLHCLQIAMAQSHSAEEYGRII